MNTSLSKLVARGQDSGGDLFWFIIREDDVVVLVVEVVLVEIDKVVDGGAELVCDGGRVERVDGIKVQHGVKDVFHHILLLMLNILLGPERHERVVERGHHWPGGLDGCAEEVAEGVVWDGRGVASRCRGEGDGDGTSSRNGLGVRDSAEPSLD